MINLSSKELDQKTRSALGYGLSFSYNNKPINPVDIIRGLINLRRKSNISESTVSVCKGFLYGSMVQQRDVSCLRIFVKTYEDLKKDDSIHITKADKTAALVIMDREDYNRKMTTILSDDTTYERIRGHPTDKVNSKFGND